VGWKAGREKERWEEVGPGLTGWEPERSLEKTGDKTGGIRMNPL